MNVIGQVFVNLVGVLSIHVFRLSSFAGSALVSGKVFDTYYSEYIKYLKFPYDRCESGIGLYLKIMKKQNYVFHLLAEDLDLIEKVSPSIVKTMYSLFFFKRVLNRSANIDFYEIRLSFYVLHHANKRRMLSLIHSVHVVACDLYRKDMFNEYMAFDALLVHLLRAL